MVGIQKMIYHGETEARGRGIAGIEKMGQGGFVRSVYTTQPILPWNAESSMRSEVGQEQLVSLVFV
jgi:hypothetical protein